MRVNTLPKVMELVGGRSRMSLVPESVLFLTLLHVTVIIALDSHGVHFPMAL